MSRLNRLRQKTVGPLVPDSKGLGVSSQPVGVPFFDGLKMQIQLYPPLGRGTLTDAEIDNVDQAIASILEKGSEDRKAVAGQVLVYCHDFLEDVGAAEFEEEIDMAMLALTDPQEVWQYVRPRHILVRLDDTAVFAVFECDCDWETEHGLAIAYRQGQDLVSVGPQG